MDEGVLASLCCCDKTLGLKAAWEGKGSAPGSHPIRGKSGVSLGRTEAEMAEEQLTARSHTVQARSGLWPSHINCQSRHWTIDMPTGQSDEGGNSSAEVPTSQVTLAVSN